MALFRPKMAVHVEELPGCPRAGPVQFHTALHCFEAAAWHARTYSRPPYDIFVRLRPDSIIRPHSAPLPNISRKDVNIYHNRLPGLSWDFVFALGPSGVMRFMEEGRRTYSGCPERRVTFQYLAYWMKHRGHWGLDHCIVRGYKKVQYMPRNNLTAQWISGLWRQADANPALMRCDGD